MTYIFDVSVEPRVKEYAKEPKMWVKTVDSVDMKQKGGFMLKGRFIGSLDSQMLAMSKNGYKLIFRNNGSYDNKIVLACVDFHYRGPSRRIVFVLLPDKVGSYINPRFPNDIAKPVNGEIKYRSTLTDKTKALVEITASVNCNKTLMAVFVDHETKYNKNSLVAAAEFLDADVKSMSHIGTVPNISPSAIEVATIAQTHPDPSLSLVPIPDEPKTKPISNRWSTKRKSTIGGDDGKDPRLPSGLMYLLEADGVVILVKDNQKRPRMMHILADYENVTQDVRDIMNEQADLLEGIAAAYRLVANMKGGDE